MREPEHVIAAIAICWGGVLVLVGVWAIVQGVCGGMLP